MPTGPGTTIDGVYQYGESDPTGPLFSDFLNLAGASIRTRLNSGKVGDTGWINLALLNSWVTSGGLTPGYRKLNGVVYLRGRISGGSGTPFTLPAGYRPGQDTRVNLADGSTGIANSACVITTAGAATVTSSTAPNLGGFTPFIADN